MWMKRACGSNARISRRQEQDPVNKKDISPTFAELAETSLQLAQENAALHILLEKSAELARRQAEVLVRITEMVCALTLNEGWERDRKLLAATFEIFCEKMRG